MKKSQCPDYLQSDKINKAIQELIDTFWDSPYAFKDAQYLSVDEIISLCARAFKKVPWLEDKVIAQRLILDGKEMLEKANKTNPYM